MLPTARRQYRIPGQVPSKEQLEMQRSLETPAPKYHPAMMLKQSGTYLSPRSIVKGLGMDRPLEISWEKFLETHIDSQNEMVLKKMISEKARGEKLDPFLRKALLERSAIAYRQMKKSMVVIVSSDELRKGEAKGGRYYKRVPSKDGKRHRYFYDEKAYKAWTGAHVSGEEATSEAITKGIGCAIEKAGKDGCDLKSLKPMVKKYGSKAVAGALSNGVKKSRYMYKGGKLYAGKA